LLAVAALLFVASCGSDTSEPAGCADVVDVAVTADGTGSRTFSVTIRSDDVGWEAYADRFEVLVDGDVVGERVLTHPHVDEQPFTRSSGGLVVGPGSVTVRAHHTTGGYCGADWQGVLD
jgi:hypothetical protein